MNAQRPRRHVPEKREAKHQQANSDVRGILHSLPVHWRHADLSLRLVVHERYLTVWRLIQALRLPFCRLAHSSAVSVTGVQRGLIRRLGPSQ
jgi:hypothetical protein